MICDGLPGVTLVPTQSDRRLGWVRVVSTEPAGHLSPHLPLTLEQLHLQGHGGRRHEHLGRYCQQTSSTHPDRGSRSDHGGLCRDLVFIL